MNQPAVTSTASEQPVAQGTEVNGQQAAAGSANAGSQANGSAGTATIDPVVQAQIESLKRQVQDSHDLIGELTARLGNTRSSEEQTAQLKAIGQQLQEAINDTENPDRAVAFIANIAQTTQQNQNELQRSFLTAYAKLIEDTPKLRDEVSFLDLQMHIAKHNIDYGALQKPKDVARLIEEVKKGNVKPVDLEAIKKEWEADFVKKQGAAGASPRPAAGTTFPTVDNKSLDSQSVASILRAKRPVFG